MGDKLATEVLPDGSLSFSATLGCIPTYAGKGSGLVHTYRYRCGLEKNANDRWADLCLAAAKDLAPEVWFAEADPVAGVDEIFRQHVKEF